MGLSAISQKAWEPEPLGKGGGHYHPEQSSPLHKKKKSMMMSGSSHQTGSVSERGKFRKYSADTVCHRLPANNLGRWESSDTNTTIPDLLELRTLPSAECRTSDTNTEMKHTACSSSLCRKLSFCCRPRGPGPAPRSRGVTGEGRGQVEVVWTGVRFSPGQHAGDRNPVCPKQGDLQVQGDRLAESGAQTGAGGGGPVIGDQGQVQTSE